MLSNSSVCPKSERSNNIQHVNTALSIATKQYDAKDVVTEVLSKFNDNKRNRSDDEKIIRSTIGLSSTLASILVPPVGVYVGGTMLLSEAIEAHHHLVAPLEIEQNKNITSVLKQNKTMTDDMIKDIIFDRCK